MALSSFQPDLIKHGAICARATTQDRGSIERSTNRSPSNMKLPGLSEHQIQQLIINYLRAKGSKKVGRPSLGSLLVQCGYCGKDIIKEVKRLNEAYKRNSTYKPYCNKSCFGKVANYKGGTVSVQGYKKMRIDGKYVQEHRYIMENHLRRKLLPNEHVHHKNHNKLDNRLENLEVLDFHEHGRIEGRRGKGIRKYARN